MPECIRLILTLLIMLDGAMKKLRSEGNTIMNRSAPNATVSRPCLLNELLFHSISLDAISCWFRQGFFYYHDGKGIGGFEQEKKDTANFSTL